MMGDLLGSFSSNVRVRAKHAEKTCETSRRSLKSFLLTARNQGEVGALQMASELIRDRELQKQTGEPWTVT